MIKNLLGRIERERVKFVEETDREAERVYLGDNQIRQLDEEMRNSGLLRYRGPGIERTTVAGLRVFEVYAADHFFIG